MKKYEYHFACLEKYIFSEEEKEISEKKGEEYEGHYEIDINLINEIGERGFKLIEIVIINDLQHAWFIKEKK
ncbi:MAG: hypothetical protein ACOCV1_00655 [Bacillota bacterium]